MPTQIQWRRGNTAQTAAFTGALAEVTVDTDKKTLVVHDGVTQGGFSLALESAQQDALAYAKANGAYDKANSANIIAQNAYNHANVAFDAANTKFSASGGTIAGNVLVTGNVTPTSDNDKYLGSPSYRWHTLYVGPGSIDIDGIKIQNTSGKLVVSGATDFTVPGAPSTGAISAHANAAFNAANTGLVAPAAFAQANAAFSKANSAYDLANNVAPQVQPAFDKANSGYGLAASGFAQANLAYDKANSATILAQGAYDAANNVAPQIQPTYDKANNAFAQANLAYTQANTGTTLAQQAYNQANTGTLLAQASFDAANNVMPQIQPSFNKANAAYDVATVAFGQANSAFGQANIAFNKANSATVLAQDAYDRANTKVSSSGGTFTGPVIINSDLTVSGNVSYTGNVTTVQITGNTGQFFGDAANGFQALYAGIPTGYTFQEQTVIQSTGNYDGFIQYNIQNINTGSNASSDLVATNDNPAGDAYIDVGINSRAYNNPTYELQHANDGYVYVNANTNYPGGNLVLSTTATGRDIIFSTGGTTHANEIARFKDGVGLVMQGKPIKFADATTQNTAAVSSAYSAGIYTTANSALGIGTSGFAQANLAYGRANSAFGQANLAYTQANTGSGVATSAFGQANLAYTQANSGYGIATSGFAQANLAYTTANSGLGIATSAFGQANLAYTAANAASTLASGKVSKTGDTMSGTLTADSFVSNTSFAVGGTSYVTISSNTYTTSSTSQVSIDAFDYITYRSAKYFVQLKYLNTYHIIELSVIHDGTTTYVSQYGEIYTSSSLGTFDAYISSNAVKLMRTAIFA
jgi:hypothetical protein